MKSRVLRGDATKVLRDLDGCTVDQVYLDPPFGTQVMWTGKAGSFSDRFEWDAKARRRLAWVADRQPHVARLIEAFALTPRARAYLLFLIEMLVELRRVLKPAGSIWLHCDDTMGAYIRLALEFTFGQANFLGIVIWKRTTNHNMKMRAFGRVHDTIFVFGRSRQARRRLWRIRSDLVVGDCWQRCMVSGFSDILLNPTSRERVGYPTQKPVALLEEFIAAGSRVGDVVLDPTCGSGTTLVAAAKLGRCAVGIDQSRAACALARRRLGAVA